MRIGSKHAWAAIALSALAATGLESCTTIEPLETGGCFGGFIVPEIKWYISVSPSGQRTGEVTADDDYANKCAEITWIDENGKSIGSEVFQLDGNGDGSFSVPGGATEMEVIIGKCPQGTSSQGAFSLSAEASAALESTTNGPLSRFVVLRRPIDPDDHEPGRRKLIHSMSVLARDLSEARSKAQAAAASGVGVMPPRDVKVLEFVELLHLPDSVQLRSSLPETMTDFRIDVNRGLHTADLAAGSNVTIAPHGSWTSCTTDIPLRALRMVSQGGEEIANSCELSYSGSSPLTQQVVQVLTTVAR